MGFKLTRYGRREIALASLILISLAVAAAFAAVRVSPWYWPAAIVPAAVWLWVLWFFRDPDRATPQGDGLFISPADGRVADITQIGADSPLGCNGVQVGVFMNVFSVHVNRAPCDARVESVVHQAGSFLDIRRADAILANESATIKLAHTYNGREYPVVIRQIAGLVARRIVTDLAPGQTVRRGQRIGMIKFGSRVELLVPRELAGQVRVEVGQNVRAGLTVLLETRQTS